MSLTPLDVGVQRFLEFTVTLVFPAVYSTGQLDAATQALLSEWPTLGCRLNSLRTDLIPSEPDNLPYVYRGKFVEQNLEDVMNISEPKQVGDEVKKLDKLFKFSNSLKKALRGQVFQVRALLLQDATIIRFIFQHPFCDATGGYRIAEAYCNILSGKKVPEVSFMRTPLRLYDGTTQEATNEKNTEKATEVIQNRTRELFTWSWRTLVQKGVKLASRDLLHPRRVENTLYIPEKQIRAWKEESQRQNINISDHDLLSAFIYQSAYEQSLPQDYTIIFGIRRQLQNQTPIHNSCIVLPINIDSLDGNQPTPAALPKIAAEVRRTILQARQPECLSKLLQFHANPSTRPMIPRWIGRKAPQVSVTSWTDLPFFNLDARGTTPSFVFGELDMWGLLKMFGLSMDDIVTTWKGQAEEEDGNGGYWIRGRLDKAVWERMAAAIGK